MSARLIQVIVTEMEKRGSGKSDSDPVRIIRQFWDTDGRLLAEVDPHIADYTRPIDPLTLPSDRL